MPIKSKYWNVALASCLAVGIHPGTDWYEFAQNVWCVDCCGKQNLLPRGEKVQRASSNFLQKVILSCVWLQVWADSNLFGHRATYSVMAFNPACNLQGALSMEVKILGSVEERCICGLTENFNQAWCGQRCQDLEQTFCYIHGVCIRCPQGFLHRIPVLMSWSHDQHARGQKNTFCARPQFSAFKSCFAGS